MYVILWRYNASSPWYLHNKPLGSEQDVRAEINSMQRYDVSGRREYRWQTIGDVSTWHDPFAEQAARDAGELEPERYKLAGYMTVYKGALALDPYSKVRLTDGDRKAGYKERPVYFDTKEEFK